MRHFTIGTDNHITVHPSRKVARETDAGVFSTEEQFADLIGPDNKRLVEIWNSIPGVKAVTKFTSRKTATERIWKAIQSLGEPITVAADVVEEPPLIQEAAVPDGPESAQGAPVAPQTPDVATAEASGKTKSTRTKKSSVPATGAHGPRDGSKTRRVIAMLQREGGVTLQKLMTEMGWQSHTTRALLSAGGSLAKKHGLTVISTKGPNGDRIYSIKS